MGTPLEEYTMEQVYRGIITGLNEAFVINEKTKNELIQMDLKNADIIKPFFIGKDIKRYSPLKAEKYLIYIPWHFPLQNDNSITGASKTAEIEFKNKYPSIYTHLLKYKEKLLARNAEETGIRYEWYALQRFGSNYYTDFEKTKIIYPEICQRPEFTYDDSKNYTNNKCFIIPRSDKFLLGILNSKLMNFLFRKKLPKLRGNFLMPAYVIFKNFPIYTPDFDNPDDKIRHDRMVTLVTEMLNLYKQLSLAKTDQEKRLIMQEIESTDRQIDSLVYGLYGLTADEIAVIEESFGK